MSFIAGDYHYSDSAGDDDADDAGNDEYHTQ